MEMCVISSGNSEIDIPVEIMSHDITVNGILLFALLIYLFYNCFLTTGSNDYTLVRNMLLFTLGEERKCIFVNTTDDRTFEDTEQLNFMLNSSVPHTPSSTTLQITDNDGKCFIVILICLHRAHNNVSVTTFSFVILR